MRFQIVDLQGTDTMEFKGATCEWWRAHVEKGWWIVAEPGDQLHLRTGLAILLYEDGAVMVLSAPATLVSTQRDQWSLQKYVNGQIQYLKSSGVVKFLTAAEVRLLASHGGTLAVAAYLGKNRAAETGAAPVIYANSPGQSTPWGTSTALPLASSLRVEV